MDNKPTIAEIVILASGAVALIFSFFPWFGNDFIDINAWDTDGFFPLTTYVPLIGLVMAGVVALGRFANVNMSARVLDFTWAQVHIALAFFAVLIAVGFLIAGDGLKFGFYLCLLASIGLLVGAVMLRQETDHTAAGPGTAPPQPF
ncbi:hypothetical protein BH20ACT2_BH20ACT2_04890 [soil metagenome]